MSLESFIYLLSGESCPSKGKENSVNSSCFKLCRYMIFASEGARFLGINRHFSCTYDTKYNKFFYLFQLLNRYSASPKYPQKEPENFPCSGAWSIISDFIFVLLSGGNFGPTSWKWMKDERTMISCCPDGVRPVIFKIELIEENT